MLERLGLRADVASDGLEAVEGIVRQPYDVVFMDVMMPRLDGLEATRRVRAQQGDQARTQIIALTANALDGDREACMEAGCDDYLSKPIQVDQLRRVLTGALRRRGRDWAEPEPDAVRPRPGPTERSAASVV